MNFTGNLTAGVTITFTANEKTIIQRGLKRAIKQREEMNLPAMTGAQIFVALLTNATDMVISSFREHDKAAPLTSEEQAQIDAIIAAAAERQVSGVPVSTPKRTRKKR